MNTRLSLLSLVFASLVCSFTTQANADDKPNVLFIICDDLNCDLGVYGHPQVKSPNIDRLASQGVLFERAYCQYPVCGPSRASFMTGLYPDQTLIRRNAIRLRERMPDVQSMSQMFIKAGYEATRVGKIYHYNVPADIGTDGHDDPASWTHTVNPKGRDKTDEAKVTTLRPGAYGGTLSWMAADGTDEEQTDGIAATEVVKLLKQYAKEDTSFFMAVGLYRPHTPYVAPKKYFELYPKEKIVVPSVPDGYLDTLPEPARLSISRKKEQFNLKEDLAKSAIQAYYASITFADAQIGRILDGLESTKLDKNTIVLFTSDHGYHMGEHGHWQKTTLFENADRVPLIISVPGSKANGQRSSSIAEMIDFYPTLAELCGLTPPAYLSGVSQVAVLSDVTAKPRKDALTLYQNGYGLRTPQFKYNEWGEDGSLGSELYDHRVDPNEMNNLASSSKHRDTIARLSKRIRERIAAANQPPVGLKQIPEPVRKRPVRQVKKKPAK